MDEVILHQYNSPYQREGIDGLAQGNHDDGFFKLIDEHPNRPIQELDQHLFNSAVEIRAFVGKAFGVRYTAEGIVQRLQHLGHSYKGTKQVPRKSDHDKQRTFQELYEMKYKWLPKKS